MRCFFLLLLLCVSQGLSAYHVDFIKNGDKNFKKLKISTELATKAGEEGKFVATIKMAAKLDYTMEVDSYLVNNGKRIEIKPVIKDDMATVTLEVTKEDLENGELHFSYQNGAGCPPMFAIKLSDLVVKNEEVN